MHRTIVEATLRYIEENFRRGFTIKELSDVLDVDFSDLERKFRCENAVTIKKFVDRRRNENLLYQLAQ